ncbi:MAG: superinfection immunity protein, partial [Actinomycetota bacterium]
MAGIGLPMLVGLYFTPLIVALIRKVPNTGSVAVINVFLGWSIIGWIVSLAMASRSVP